MCEEEKPLDQFYADKRRKDGRGIYCKLCWKVRYQTEEKDKALRSAAVRRYYDSKKDTSEYKEKRKYEQLRYLYGISREQYEELLRLQNNECAVCFRSFTKVKPHVDHDHSCCSGNKSCGNCVRGILCTNCNTSIGLLKDDIQTLQNAIHYLERK